MLNSFRRIVDVGYEHALRLFRENDTGVVRLQAAVQTGELKRMPVWTAFITHQIRVPGWASRDIQRVVLLADIQQYIFTTDYVPQKTSSGAFKLTFIISSGIVATLVHFVFLLTSSDARDFVECLKEIGGMPTKRDEAEMADESDVRPVTSLVSGETSEHIDLR